MPGAAALKLVLNPDPAEPDGVLIPRAVPTALGEAATLPEKVGTELNVEPTAIGSDGGAGDVPPETRSDELVAVPTSPTLLQPENGPLRPAVIAAWHITEPEVSNAAISNATREIR